MNINPVGIFTWKEYQSNLRYRPDEGRAWVLEQAVYFIHKLEKRKIICN